jgi:hypothetical protein
MRDFAESAGAIAICVAAVAGLVYFIGVDPQA